jgi:hypothetical protein
MKAIVCDRYGSPSVLVLRDVEKPAPAEDEVVIRVRASSINSRDDRRMRANPFFIRFMAGGLFRPGTQILGADRLDGPGGVGPEYPRLGPEEPACHEADEEGIRPHPAIVPRVDRGSADPDQDLVLRWGGFLDVP